MKAEKINIIKIPSDATQVEVRIDGDVYPLILAFDDKKITKHFWLENGKYDGWESDE